MSAGRHGGPAFPTGPDHYPDSVGMSLRDWFAGQALVAMGMWLPVSTYPEAEAEAQKMRADYAYQVADAMLKAREFRP